MTYRIDTSQGDERAHLAFEGLLDQTALDALRSSIDAARRDGARTVLLRLGVGTTLDIACIGQLAAIESLAVEAASPFLSHWLRQAGIRINPSEESS